MHIFTPVDLIETTIRLGSALLLGALVGTERTFAHKSASMRTYALVALGAALFTVISIIVAEQYLAVISLDPLRMAAQVVLGIGFLGSGLIIFQKEHLSGVTTAAGLWVAAGIGLACGFGLYYIAMIAALLTLFIFSGLWVVEEKFRGTFTFGPKDHHDHGQSQQGDGL